MLVLDKILSKGGPLSDLRRIERSELAGFDPSNLVGDLVGVGGPEPSVLRLDQCLLKG